MTKFCLKTNLNIPKFFLSKAKLKSDCLIIDCLGGTVERGVIWSWRKRGGGGNPLYDNHLSPLAHPLAHLINYSGRLCSKIQKCEMNESSANCQNAELKERYTVHIRFLKCLL